MCGESGDSNEGGRVGPGSDEALVVEHRAENCEFVGFVVLPMYDEHLV